MRCLTLQLGTLALHVRFGNAIDARLLIGTPLRATQQREATSISPSPAQASHKHTGRNARVHSVETGPQTAVQSTESSSIKLFAYGGCQPVLEAQAPVLYLQCSTGFAARCSGRRKAHLDAEPREAAPPPQAPKKQQARRRLRITYEHFQHSMGYTKPKLLEKPKSILNWSKPLGLRKRDNENQRTGQILEDRVSKFPDENESEAFPDGFHRESVSSALEKRFRVFDETKSSGEPLSTPRRSPLEGPLEVSTLDAIRRSSRSSRTLDFPDLPRIDEDHPLDS